MNIGYDAARSHNHNRYCFTASRPSANNHSRTRRARGSLAAIDKDMLAVIAVFQKRPVNIRKYR